MKRFMAAMLTGVLTIGLLAGCQGKTSDGDGSSDTDKAEGLNVFFVTAMSGGVCWGPAQEGFEKACEDLGYEGTWIGPTEDSNTPEMVTLCENALTQGADVLICVPMDDEPFADVFTKAQEQGVPVITVCAEVSEDYSDAFVGTEPKAYGAAQAQALYDMMEDKDEEINLVYMQSLLTTVNQNTQYEACMDKLEELGVKVNLSLHEECQSSSTTAADRLSALKKTYPEINAVIMADGYGTEGCGAFVQDGNYADEIYAVGCDDTEPTMNYVKSGALDCSLIQNFYDMGYKSVELGKEFIDNGSIERVNDTGSYVLTADQVDEHAKGLGITLAD